MKYFTIEEPTSLFDSTPIYTTYSEEEILQMYWDYWYDRMCNKFGKDEVDSKYSKQDCIYDWAITNWAWESN
jgi:hypothetical protein